MKPRPGKTIVAGDREITVIRGRRLRADEVAIAFDGQTSVIHINAWQQLATNAERLAAIRAE